MLSITFDTDLANLNLDLAAAPLASFALCFPSFTARFRPFQVESAAVSRVFALPYEKGQACTLQLLVSQIGGQKPRFLQYSTNQFSLEDLISKGVEEYFDAEFSVKLKAKLESDARYLTLPNVLCQTDLACFPEDLTFFVQSGELQLETALFRRKDRLGGMERSLVLPLAAPAARSSDQIEVEPEVKSDAKAEGEAKSAQKSKLETQKLTVGVQQRMGDFCASLCCCQVVFQLCEGQTISLQFQISDCADLQRVSQTVGAKNQGAELQSLLCQQVISALGAEAAEPAEFVSLLGFKKAAVQTRFKPALKKLRALKLASTPMKSLNLRLFLNATRPLQFYQISRFNSFSKSFSKPPMPFLIFNFSPCDALRDSWVILSTQNSQISSHVNNVNDAQQPVVLQFADCENCVCYFRDVPVADGGMGSLGGKAGVSAAPQSPSEGFQKLCATLPQIVQLLDRQIAVEERLAAILALSLQIVVVVNEKQFFKLPISLQQYEESVVGSIVNGSQYKIQLEVRYTGIVINFTFNFQLCDTQLQQFMLAAKKKPAIKQIPPRAGEAPEKTPAALPERDSLKGTKTADSGKSQAEQLNAEQREGAKTALPAPQRRVRKILKKVAKNGGTQSRPHAQSAALEKSDDQSRSDDKCDHLGSDSLELDDGGWSQSFGKAQGGPEKEHYSVKCSTKQELALGLKPAARQAPGLPEGSGNSQNDSQSEHSPRGGEAAPKKKKRIVKKKKLPRLENAQQDSQDLQSLQGELKKAPSGVDDFALPELSGRRMRK